jgi:hypothetical protein
MTVVVVMMLVVAMGVIMMIMIVMIMIVMMVVAAVGVIMRVMIMVVMTMMVMITMRMVMVMTLPMLVMMDALGRSARARILAEYQRLDGHRHRVGRQPDLAEVDVVEIAQDHAVDRQISLSTSSSSRRIAPSVCAMSPSSMR